MQQQNMVHEENVRFVYIRALEHLAERLDIVRKDIGSTKEQFVKQDLIKYEYEISKMIQGYREGNAFEVGNNKLLHAALELYRSDIQGLGEDVKQKVGLDDKISLPLVDKEIEFVDRAIRKFLSELSTKNI